MPRYLIWVTVFPNGRLHSGWSSWPAKITTSALTENYFSLSFLILVTQGKISCWSILPHLGTSFPDFVVVGFNPSFRPPLRSIWKRGVRSQHYISFTVIYLYPSDKNREQTGVSQWKTLCLVVLLLSEWGKGLNTRVHMQVYEPECLFQKTPTMVLSVLFHFFWDSILPLVTSNLKVRFTISDQSIFIILSSLLRPVLVIPINLIQSNPNVYEASVSLVLFF